MNAKIEGQEKVTGNLDSHMKQVEGTINGELAKMRKQIKDLGEGKVTSEAELQQIGEDQAAKDDHQDKIIAEVKEELSARIDALQKEIKKLKIASGSNLQSTFGANAAGDTLQRTRTETNL